MVEELPRNVIDAQYSISSPIQYKILLKVAAYNRQATILFQISLNFFSSRTVVAVPIDENLDILRKYFFFTKPSDIPSIK